MSEPTIKIPDFVAVDLCRTFARCSEGIVQLEREEERNLRDLERTRLGLEEAKRTQLEILAFFNAVDSSRDWLADVEDASARFNPRRAVLKRDEQGEFYIEELEPGQ